MINPLLGVLIERNGPNAADNVFVVQNAKAPNAIQDAILDLMRPGITQVRVCSAYLSTMGSRLLFDGVRRSGPAGTSQTVCKTIVTSLDFGLTDPEALRFWHRDPTSRVLVAGVSNLRRGRLAPTIAFHPKLYVFDRLDGRPVCSNDKLSTEAGQVQNAIQDAILDLMRPGITRLPAWSDRRT